MENLGYSDSFKKLGYVLDAPRTDWSAANDTGVCLSLWTDEMRFIEGVPVVDTKIDCGLIEEWQHKQGAKKRLKHLTKSWNEHDRWIDLVRRHGGPEDENVPSNPWIVSNKRGYKWRLQTFEQNTGHFSAKPEIL